jgi:hypothetical protein
LDTVVLDLEIVVQNLDVDDDGDITAGDDSTDDHSLSSQPFEQPTALF